VVGTIPKVFVKVRVWGLEEMELATSRIRKESKVKKWVLD
jgi:hypothetical protein